MHHTDRRGLLIGRVALGCLLLVGIVLSGCTPTAEPTMPPATKMAAAPATAAPPATNTPVPPPPTAVPPSATPVPPTAVPTEMPAQRQPLKVTILHTNDLMGEIDPCG